MLRVFHIRPLILRNEMKSVTLLYSFFRYHRLLRSEKTKQQIKDFETLQKTDPEAALKQLEMLEKNRAEERATLRHRNTGKWARNQVIKAKYNKEVSFELKSYGGNLSTCIKNVILTHYSL